MLQPHPQYHNTPTSLTTTTTSLPHPSLSPVICCNTSLKLPCDRPFPALFDDTHRWTSPLFTLFTLPFAAADLIICWPNYHLLISPSVDLTICWSHHTICCSYSLLILPSADLITICWSHHLLTLLFADLTNCCSYYFLILQSADLITIWWSHHQLTLLFADVTICWLYHMLSSSTSRHTIAIIATQFCHPSRLFRKVLVFAVWGVRNTVQCEVCGMCEVCEMCNFVDACSV